MKKIKKIILLVLLLATAVMPLAACKKENNYGGDTTAPKYDPYDNVLKDPVNTGSQISVSGKSYVYESIDVRNSAAEMQVTLGASLAKLYKESKFRFTAENKVLFEEGAADDALFFAMSETEGVRDGNVLTVKHTNSAGVKYDVRFEIHEDKIYVIHNGHSYNQDGIYATFVFRLVA